MVEIDWEALLQIARKCTRYACKACNEPYSDDVESQGQYVMYTFAIKFRADLIKDLTLERYISFNVIREVKKYILRNRKRGKRWVEYKTAEDMTKHPSVIQAQGLLSDVEKDDEIFITRMLEGLPCSKKNQMIAKYCQPI